MFYVVREDCNEIFLKKKGAESKQMDIAKEKIAKYFAIISYKHKTLIINEAIKKIVLQKIFKQFNFKKY